MSDSYLTSPTTERLKDVVIPTTTATPQMKAYAAAFLKVMDEASRPWWVRAYRWLRRTARRKAM